MASDTAIPAVADRPWTNTSLSPQERARLLVAAMTLEQKIAQLHGAMETIDIYEVTRVNPSAGDLVVIRFSCRGVDVCLSRDTLPVRTRLQHDPVHRST